MSPESPYRTGRRIAWTIFWLSAVALLVLSYLVHTGRTFSWDYAGAHQAAIAADEYNHPETIHFFMALMIPVDWRPTVVIAVLSMLILALRRSGWATLLPLLLILTAVLEYATKEIVHQPWPTPEVVTQPTLALAQSYHAWVPQHVCLPALHLNSSKFINEGCMDGSYLSGACARAILISGVIGWWALRARWLGPLRLLVPLALLAYTIGVGVGRVYLRWHWPSDTIAGYLLGIMCLCVIWLCTHSSRKVSRPAAG